MGKILLVCIILLSWAIADENVFWSDLEKVYLQNVQITDTNCKPAISRIRKLFYDGFRWDLLIPDAKKYIKPNDPISLDFQKKYKGEIIILGQPEDFKHALAGLDSYFHPSRATGEVRETSGNSDLCTWLGDIASALAEAYKQQIPVDRAFQLYAGDVDLRANIAAFHICALSAPYGTETYKFPIVEICRGYYQSWHDPNSRAKLIQEYSSKLGLVMQANGQFTAASRSQFCQANLGTLKSVALVYYYTSRVVFSDADANRVLNLFLDRLEYFYALQ